jgi:hypothetical protein
MKDKIKIMVMTIVAFIATTFSTNGFPETMDAWIVFGVTAAGILITYVAKNFVLPSTSDRYSLNWMDLVSGGLLAIGATITNFVAGLAIGDKMDWNELGKLLLVVIVGYFSKTLLQETSKVTE